MLAAQRLDQRRAEALLLALVAADLAAQDGDWIGAVQRLVVLSALNRRDAKAHRLARDRMLQTRAASRASSTLSSPAGGGEASSAPTTANRKYAQRS
jgi:hypothetical protein